MNETNLKIKETVDRISSDSAFIECHVLFTMVPFNPLSE